MRDSQSSTPGHPRATISITDLDGLDAPCLSGFFDTPTPVTMGARLRAGCREELLALPGDGRVSWEPGGVLLISNDAISIRVRQQARAEGTVLRWSLEAHRDVLLDEVSLLVVPWPNDPPLSAHRIYRNGFSSWTPTGSVRAGEPPRLPRVRAFSLMNHHVDSPRFGRRDGVLSHDVLVLQADDAVEALLIGFLSAKAGLGEIFVENRDVERMAASLCYGGKSLGPGDVVDGEPLLLARGKAEDLLERWAEALGDEMGARRGERSPVGWCSWYEYYDKVSEADVLANLKAVKAHPELGIEFLQVDDGYQAAIGDWLELDPRFSGGLERLTSRIREAGLAAGVWVAPFFAEPRSRLFEEHPDWFLKDDRGRFVNAGFNPVWRTSLYSLDLTHPEVLSWLRATFQALVDAGFDYFKIDFLFAGIREGVRHDPRLSPLEAYRQGLRAIREAIGEERFLLGCGAPISGSIGFVDGMRIGADVKESWDDLLPRLFGAGAGYPSARLAIAGTLTRAFMHGRLWLNDPDCLLVRDRNTKLTPAEIELLVTALGMSGGMLFLSDDLTALSPERLDMAKAVLPPTRSCPSPVGVMDSDPPDRVVLHGELGTLVALINWDSRPSRRPWPLKCKETAFDFWRERAVTREDAPPLPGHGVAALLFTKPLPRPHPIGTTLHLTALIDGRITAEWSDDSLELTLTGREMARRAGRIWLRLPGGYVLAAEPGGCVTTVEPWEQGVVLSLETAPEWSVALRFDRKQV